MPQGFELPGDPSEPDEDADGKHGEIGSFVGWSPIRSSIGRTRATEDGADLGWFSRRLGIHISQQRNRIAGLHCHIRKNYRCT